MNTFEKIMKDGWHPESKGRRDSQGLSRVTKWTGKKSDDNYASEHHSSAPLTTLKNPASFGPPPKHLPDASLPSGSLSGKDRNSMESRDLEVGGSKSGLVARRLQRQPPDLPVRATPAELDASHSPVSPVRGVDSDDADLPSRVLPQYSNLPPKLPPRVSKKSNPDASTISPSLGPQLHPGTEPSECNQGSIRRQAKFPIRWPRVESIPGSSIVNPQVDKETEPTFLQHEKAEPSVSRSTQQGSLNAAVATEFQGVLNSKMMPMERQRNETDSHGSTSGHFTDSARFRDYAQDAFDAHRKEKTQDCCINSSIPDPRGKINNPLIADSNGSPFAPFLPPKKDSIKGNPIKPPVPFLTKPKNL